MRAFHQTMSNATTIDLRLKSVFDLTDKELQERLRPTYEAMKKEKFAKGGYITYYDPSVCPTTSHAVHEYADRKDLMWMDDKYQEHFIKTL
ncbi:hypothetical protein [Mucilaginibacter lacusdianchii]|uniref:hypothetical protein n=1 Tax=Mucilaginibacter lacusdianchii TaxID=2684211 RepID=UPI00131C6194|nr:hypothetical protein [Mucilaginibacter sp. JXJ CY 39]